MKDSSSEKTDSDKAAKMQPSGKTPETTSSTSTDVEQIPASWNQTDRHYPLHKCVHELFEERAERIPDAVAVIYRTEQLTYGQLNERANQLAHYLRKQGVEPDTPVGVCLHRSTEMIVAIMAALKAGGAYVPLDPADPKERLALIIDATGASIILTQQKWADNLPSVSEHMFCIDSEWATVEALSRTNPEHITASRNLAYMMFTSGSTGVPKGVMIEHAALVNHLWWLQETFVLTRSDRLLQKTPFTFDVSAYELFLPLIAGSTLVFAKPGGHRDPIYLNDVIVRERITNVHFVPSMLEVFLQHPRASELRHLKRVICSGEALPHYLRERFFESLPHAELHNLYGPTEAAIHVSWWDCRNEPDQPIVPIGRPTANVQLHILDDHLKPVPVGTEGQLFIGGVQLARGYLNRPDLTREVFIPNPFDPGAQTRLYKTGDLCRYLPDGNIEFLGRLDNQVQIRGVRIELGEIETVLGNHSAVRQAVVLAREDQPGDKQLVAYVVCSQPTELRPDDLLDYLRATLPEYMIPSALVFMDSMPLTASGKADRKALPSPGQSIEAREVSLVPPETPTQKIIAEIFAEVLCLDTVGIHENFFELGGHSLTATKAVYGIHSRLSVELPIRSLFENPTVSKLSQLAERHSIEADGQTRSSSIPVLSREGRLPASYAQIRMWFLYEYYRDTPLYNIPLMLHFRGSLSVKALEESLNHIIQRHESLRTTFDIRDGEPVQVVHPHEYQRLPVETVTEFPSRESGVSAGHPMIKEETKTLFDLRQGPLIRFRMFHLSPAEHCLLLTLHHIVFDGWSVDVLLRELAAAYAARIEGRDPDLPPLPIQYADYAKWQRRLLEGEARQKQLSYWLNQLEPPLPFLELPTNKPRPTTQTHEGRWKSVTLNRKLTDDLREFSHQQGTTLLTTLLAAFKVLLHLHTGQEDLIVGCPIANRTREETEPLIGFFVNTVALRTDLSANPTFYEFLGQVQQVCLQAHANQDLPFEQLVSQLQPERDLTRPPVFQVMFVFQNTRDRRVSLPDLEIECEEISTDTAKFDLTVSVEDRGDQLIATAEYNTDLFETDTIEQLLRRYQYLLREIVSDGNRHVGELGLLLETERRQVFGTTDQVQSDYPRDKCVHELFDEQVEKTPDATALIYQTERLTYQQLNERANQLARYLRKRGVKPDTLVGVCLDRRTEMIVALLAILKAGGAYVPLDASYPRGRLEQMIEDAELKTILTQHSTISHMESHQGQVICLDTDWDMIGNESADSPVSVTQPDHLAYVMFTSGSTGRPKGVEIPHRGVVSLLFGVNYVNLQGRQTFLQLAPISFDASTFEIWGALLHGHCCVLFPGRIPELHELADILDAHNVNCLWLTASLFNLIIDERPSMLRGLSQLLVGGEALSVDHVRRALESLPDAQLINGYGPTECTTFSCCYSIPKHLDQGIRSIPIGRPIAHAQAYILDKQLSPVPGGVPGELCIGGDGLARGYLNRPGLTRRQFIANPFDPSGQTKLYKTGDRCRYATDGNIEFLGRLDHQVKIRGFRIELGEIESVLGRHPSVRQAVVVAREDQPADRQLVAYVARSQQIGPDSLRRHLEETLPEYMIPSTFLFLDSMPLTPNRKIDRHALPAPEEELTRGEVGYALPETPTQKALAEIFSEVLGLAKVSIHDDFFKIGGHSLLAVKLLDKIQARFHKSLPLATFFREKTVKRLSELLAMEEGDTPHSSIVLIRAGGSRDPIFVLPGIGGHSMGFSALANRLDLDRPVYGLELQGLDGKTAPHKTIEEMASYFMGLVRQIQKQGPYHLAGYSLGGRIAFEMALQLAEQGQQVGMLAMIAATAPGYPRTSKHRLVRYGLRSVDFLRLPVREKLNYLSFKITTDMRRRLRLRRQERPTKSEERHSGRSLRANIAKVQKSAYEAWYAYKPKAKYSGNVLLFRDANVDSPLYRNIIDSHAGWDRYVTGTVESHEIPSGHTDILKEPRVDLIADILRSHISPTGGTVPGSSSNPVVPDKQGHDKPGALLAWPSVRDALTIQEDELHVFLADLNGSSESLSRHRSLLSADERERADGYARSRDRDRFVARRGYLRELLSRYTGIRPLDIELQYSEDGKAHLSEDQNLMALRFSVSTCDGLAMYAFTCKHEVGIDLEHIRPVENLLELAEQQFSSHEYKALRRLPGNLQHEAFYTCWTS
ncbi:MAG: amino acid adenylation domain-containing protein, partial [Phycisphaerales bacterium]